MTPVKLTSAISDYGRVWHIIRDSRPVALCGRRAEHWQEYTAGDGSLAFRPSCRRCQRRAIAATLGLLRKA